MSGVRGYLGPHGDELLVRWAQLQAMIEDDKRTFLGSGFGALRFAV